MINQTEDTIRVNVRESYSKVAENGGIGCECTPQGGCCGSTNINPGVQAIQKSSTMGYTDEELKSVPESSNMGLGCGNPQVIAALKKGEVVLDMGSGGGFDCFLAAKKVGSTGRVIGIDMTPEMLGKARNNAQKGNYTNVEFRLGEIEHIPVADDTVDVIMSNCVINLSPNKLAVFQDALRVLKPGGRLAISDIIATAELPEKIKSSPELYCECISGAIKKETLIELLEKAGFEEINVELLEESRKFIHDWLPEENIEQYIVSATIQAVKAKSCCCC